MRTALYTIGYEGRALDEFLAILGANKISRLIDIRELPLSRRRGFSKTPLENALRAAGIEYVHLRLAGNPDRKLRHELPAEQLLARYARHLDATAEVVEVVAEHVQGRRAALLCYEADPACCHRSVLAERLEQRLGLRARDL